MQKTLDFSKHTSFVLGSLLDIDGHLAVRVEQLL
jgi:hypothetical protein